DPERFQRGAQEYAAYLKTPGGRLRLDLSIAHLQEFLPHPAGSLLALDIGCGTGAVGVRLAELGFHVTLLDSSQPMLDIAERAAKQAHVGDKIAVKHGDAVQLAALFEVKSFDVIVCHNVLEYVDDPNGVLRAAACLLRGPSSILSVLVRSQAGEVLKAALLNGDLAVAEVNLTADWAEEALYGGRVRLFTPAGLQAMLEAASLAVISARGVRIISDYLPPRISRDDENEAIFRLECQLGKRPEFGAVARYTQCLASLRA
ncbi:MAG TPA: methyltransferase domain-containing protein, partial [Candidatus Binatia bacterium]|nr:methyltransferase domain-containing protein [Candidatus Binatia bacterium]